jgi:hypothetical protein
MCGIWTDSEHEETIPLQPLGRRVKYLMNDLHTQTFVAISKAKGEIVLIFT